jgi:tRNA (guanine26-N2/guanine27-N2)-dimethyltransferase
MDIIEEGGARFYASRDRQGKISKELDVFYNPVMKYNRDVTIALLKSIQEKDLQICDLMAGSGVRSLRMLKELEPEKIGRIVANDFDEGFLGLMQKNIEMNGLSDASKLSLHSMDANKLLLESSGFDYIDIDPFGSPNDFLENSIVRLSRRGILAVTATDTAPLAGTYQKACMRKYWARPMRNHLMHEVGLRILIRKVQLIGASHDKALIPIYCYYRDHYFRAFFKCVKGKEAVDTLIAQHAYILHCEKCDHVKVSDVNCGTCCESVMQWAGPMWTGKLCDEELAVSVSEQMTGDRFSLWIVEESKLNVVGFYDVHALAKKHKISIPKYDSILERLGKGASRTHFSLTGIRTAVSPKEFLAVVKDAGDAGK